MKKLIPTLVVVLLLTPTLVFAGQNKITICHLPPGNPSNGQTISIPVAQWEGPGGHSTGGHGGDYAGECQNPAATPTPTTTATPTVTPTPTIAPEPTPTSDPNASPTPEPTPTGVPEPTPTTIVSPTPTSAPEPTPTSDPNASPTPEPTPTNSPEPTVESEVQGTIDQIIALIEKLVDFVQNF